MASTVVCELVGTTLFSDMYLLEDAAGRDAAAKIVSQVVRKTYDFAYDA